MLDATDLLILDYEATHPNTTHGRRAEDARQYGMTLTRWNQRLIRIVRDPEALRLDPMTVYRLRRLARF